jgi:glycosyltransferase involved in cell wall biosynthesis
MSQPDGLPNDRAKARVAFVNSHPIQYFVPLYRRINASDDIEAVPVYLTRHGLRGDIDPGFGQAFTWDIDLLSGTNPIFAKGAESRALNPGPLRMIVPDIWRIIRNGDFDAVVIHGHNFGANHVAALAAKSRGIPVLTRGETHLGLPMSPLKTAVRKVIMSAYYRLFGGFLTIGTLNRAFYRAMGVPESRIFSFPYTVDNDRMIAAATLSADERTAWRARIGVTDDKPAILFLSKFQPRKHAGDLIGAARLLKDRGLDCHIILAGSGEMDAALHAQAAEQPDLSIHFPGFFNQSDVPKLLGACDIFVLPSQAEPWGLIVNEAMCAGLPIVASEEIGSVVDLVRPGVNGATFPATNVPALAAALEPMLRDPAARAAMGQASLDIIRDWNYDRCVEGLRAGLVSLGRLPAPLHETI